MARTRQQGVLHGTYPCKTPCSCLEKHDTFMQCIQFDITHTNAKPPLREQKGPIAIVTRKPEKVL